MPLRAGAARRVHDDRTAPALAGGPLLLCADETQQPCAGLERGTPRIDPRAAPARCEGGRARPAGAPGGNRAQRAGRAGEELKGTSMADYGCTVEWTRAEAAFTDQK